MVFDENSAVVQTEWTRCTYFCLQISTVIKTMELYKYGLIYLGELLTFSEKLGRREDLAHYETCSPPYLQGIRNIA